MSRRVNRHCFVPGCKSGYSSQLKKNKEISERNPSLFKPRNITDLEKWSKAISRPDKQLEMTDCVCDLHFREKEVVRYYEQKLSDGSIFKLERGRPILTADAVPSIFPHLPDYLPNSMQERKSSMIQDEETQNYEIKKTEDNSNIESLQFYIDGDVSFQQENLIADSFNFQKLVKNMHNIETPSASWGISLISEFGSRYVMLAKWKTYVPERRIAIDESLNIKVFLKGREIDPTLNKVTCIDDVIQVLKSIDSYELCSGIENREINDCLYYLEPLYTSPGRKSIYCQNCRLSRRRESDALRIRSAEQKGQLVPALHHRLLYSRRKVSRLQQKVVILRRSLETSKKESAIASQEAIEKAINHFPSSQQEFH